MDGTHANSLGPSLRLFARVGAVLVALVGALALAGWALGLDVLKSILPGFVTMKPNAAAAFVLTGVSARLLAAEPTPAPRRVAGRVLALAAAVIGFATLVEYLAHVDLGIDQLLFAEASGAIGTSHPARMAPNSALGFVLIGCALFGLDWETPHGHRPAQFFALAAGLIPLQALIAYGYGAEPPRASVAYTQIPLNSGMAFGILTIAVLLVRPETGLMRLIGSDGPAGFMARRLTGAIVFLPIIVGWLFLVSRLQAGGEGAMQGASLVVVSAIVIGGAVVYWNAVLLERMELERSRVEVSLREQREWFRTTLGSIGDAVVAVDTLGAVTLVNGPAERILGTTHALAAGRAFEDVFRIADGRSHAILERPLADVVDRQEVVRLPPGAVLLASGGGEVPLEGSAAPIQDARGHTLGVVLVFRDMSVQRAIEDERAALLAREKVARAEAERASRAKDEFIATVSHELRTPLNAVLGWARLLRMGKLDAPSNAKAVESIERSATLQAQIVDDLLDASRIVRGQLRLDVRPVDLVSVIEAAIDTVRPAAAARGIEIVAALGTRGTGTVSGDPGRLQQVVWNLLANAIKFTSQAGRVELKLERGDSHVELHVKDTGAGIAPEFLPHLFERFRQADSSSTRAHGGLGLGLAIVRHLVEAHGGTVSAQSDGIGRGATFSVMLPVLAQRPRRAAPEAPRPLTVPDPTPLALHRLQGLRVLIVDDDEDTLEVVKQLLEQAGAQVTAAPTAQAALTALRGSAHHVLVSDIGMPGEDGYTLIRKVRALPASEGGDVPAAALTAYTQAEDRRQALAAGYQAYLAKPIDPVELTAAVARLANEGRASAA